MGRKLTDKKALLVLIDKLHAGMAAFVSIEVFSSRELRLKLPAYLLADPQVFCQRLAQHTGLNLDQIVLNVVVEPYVSQLNRAQDRRVKNVILIGSGKGGVGKSTVSVLLALALKRLGAKVGLMDGDIYGPSVPRMLGVSTSMQTDSGQFIPINCHGISAISIGWLVDPKEPTVWRGPILSRVLTQFFEQTRWPDLDYLLVDLPPGTGDTQLTIAQKVPVSGAVIVSTPQAIAMDDAIKAKHMFDKMGILNLGWVKNMAGFVCGECQSETEILKTDSQHSLLKIGCLGSIPMDSNICYAADSGQLHELDPAILSRYTDLAVEVQMSLLKQSSVSALCPWPKVEVQTRG